MSEPMEPLKILADIYFSLCAVVSDSLFAKNNGYFGMALISHNQTTRQSQPAMVVEFSLQLPGMH